MANGIVTVEDVAQEINYLESLMGGLSADDEFMRAILRNQKIMLQSMVAFGNVQTDTGQTRPVIGGVDTSNLPSGIAGTSLDDMKEGTTGDALFDISGTKIVVDIKANSDINENEVVVITGSDNQVVPASGIEPSSVSGGENTGPDKPVFGGTAPDEVITVDNEDYVKHNLDLIADDLVLLFDGDLVLSMDDPNEGSNEVLLLPSDSPLTIGPDKGLQRDKFWYKRGPDQTSDFNIRIISTGEPKP